MRLASKCLLLLALATGLVVCDSAHRSFSKMIHLSPNASAIVPPRQKKSPIPGLMLSKIEQNLADREYNITYDDVKRCLQSPNRIHGFRANYKPGQLSIVARKVSVVHNFELNLINEGIYADGRKLYAPQQTAQACERGNKLLIRHRGFAEEYINSARGLRQNFIIETAPMGTQKLQVKLVPKGMQITSIGSNELIMSQEKDFADEQLRYSDLRCWDVRGKLLQSSLAYKEGKIQIEVGVQNAVYPITIDPIIENVTPENAYKIVAGNQALSSWGESVSGAGDVNNDGFDDIVIGAKDYDITQPNEGAAFVFYGTSTGIDVTSPAMLRIGQQDAKFGMSVTNAGDLNNDGFDDIAVGAPYFDHEDTDEGAVFVFLGGKAGVNQIPQAQVEGNFSSANMGYAVSGAGNVNSDLYDDLIVAAPNWQNGEAAEGAGFVFHGSEQGLDQSIKATLETNTANSYVASVSCAGDVNNDGYDDVVIGALGYTNDQLFEGAAFVYYGSPSGISLNGKSVLEGNQQFTAMGVSVSGAGDVNGDGFDDITVGASEYTNGQSHEGVVFVFQGSPIGIGLIPATILEKNQAEADFGHSVSGLGDFNTDGFDDVVVGAYHFENGQVGEGAAFIFLGSLDGLKPTDLVYESNESYSQFGISVKNAGDIDGDGISDVLIGAPYFEQTNEGSVFIFGSVGNSFPVTLISFSAKIFDKAVKLQFSTTSEINADRFDIQRCGPSKQWFSIGEVAAHENATTSHDYTFIDVQPVHGENLYRLKMIDKDQTYTFSSVKAVKFDSQDYELLVISPNPTAKSLRIKSTPPDLLTFLTSNGQQVFEIEYPKTNEDIDISFLHSGVYLVLAKFSDGRTVTERLIVGGH